MTSLVGYQQLPAATHYNKHLGIQQEVKTRSQKKQERQQTTTGKLSQQQSSTGHTHQKQQQQQLPTRYSQHLSRFSRNLSSTTSSSRALTLLTVAVILFMCLLNEGAGVVVHQVRFMAGKSGRQDYALAGESLELSCHYIMKDAAEEVKQIVWSKDGKNFLRWRKNKPGLEVLSYTYKGHLDSGSQHSRLIIHNVTTAMHGRYKCLVRTDLSIHEGEQQLTVISQAHCKVGDWRVLSRPSECSETFQLDCRNMFPKPIPSCGLWNNKSDKFIRSVVVDISEESRSNINSLASGNTERNSSSNSQVLTRGDLQQTFRIRHVSKFKLSPSSDLLQYAGHLVFKCDIGVPDTNWRMSLVTPMFHYEDACLEDPLETIERMRSNYSHYTSARIQLMHNNPPSSWHASPSFKMLSSDLNYELLGPLPDHNQEAQAAQGSSSISALHTLADLKRTLGRPKLNCWQRPLRGSIASLSCSNGANHIKLVGTSLLQCQSNGWVPLAIQPLASNSERGRARASAVARRRELSLRRISTNDYPDGDVSEDLSAGNNELEERTTTTSPQTTEFEFIPKTSVGNHQVDEATQLDGVGSTTATTTTAFSLPTCVSIRRSSHLAENSGNKLPLLDEAFSQNSFQKVFKGGFIWPSFSSSSAPSIQPVGAYLVITAILSTSFLTTILHSNPIRNYHLLHATSNRSL